MVSADISRRVPVLPPLPEQRSIHPDHDLHSDYKEDLSVLPLSHIAVPQNSFRDKAESAEYVPFRGTAASDKPVLCHKHG